MARRGRKEIESLCWDCKHAVPNFEKLQGCSWSAFFIPVKGWDAIPTIINNGYVGTNDKQILLPKVKSYCVLHCPNFEKG